MDSGNIQAPAGWFLGKLPKESEDGLAVEAVWTLWRWENLFYVPVTEPLSLNSQPMDTKWIISSYSLLGVSFSTETTNKKTAQSTMKSL